jgi:hypothetical protein
MMRRRTLTGSLLTTVALSCVSQTWAQEAAVSESDRTLVATFFDLSNAIGERVWTGWKEAPEAVLLVGEETETLFRHPSPSADFTHVGDDPHLGSMHVRPRVFDTSLLAAFPAVGGIPTIVVGRPEALGLTPTDWVLTLMHEHFHQIQMSQPGYAAMVADLDLSDGDSTGMWMLTYPFPYAEPGITRAFADQSRLLAETLEAPEMQSFQERLTDYRSAVETTSEMLAEKDFLYMVFQIWQEGVARYVELRAADIAAELFEPSFEFTRLPGFEDFDDAANDRLERLRLDLRSGGGTAVAGRAIFYPLGAGEAILLDRTGAVWRDRYLTDVRSLTRAFELLDDGAR